MSGDEVASGRSDLPFDGESGDSAWESDPADVFSDPTAVNLFTAEIEHVDASDWDVDTALIWGDEVDDVVDSGGIGVDGSMGLDFPL
ncbi:hypothetical protein [Agromyces laixinhei]|uniref:hypothetical protein n=1 Tax=Agromyces laixinhei TaxID=2585717 RepID=UPI0012ECED0D|nr:hypothetical protein [Agromyces laixinhei]